MAWERGAWEKKTSQGAGYISNDSSYNENINSRSSVNEKFSGGLSFCPKCGSMMRNSYGSLTCSKCGYSKEGHDSSRSTHQQAGVNSRQTKNQMNDVLRVMRQGKTRSQAAQILDIPLSRINHWYEYGSIGVEKHASHFYREVKYIEEDRERRRREEINRRNREIEERKRRQRLEREKHERQEYLRKQQADKKIKRKMDSVISQLKNGKTRQQAANYAGVSRFTIDEWYDKGLRRKGEPYITFYNQVKKIESEGMKKSEKDKFIKCPKCGRFYNSSKIHCPHCKKDTKSIKTKTTSTVNNTEKQMAKVLSLMRRGSSRYDAAQKAGVSVVTVNNWYNKGSRGEAAYTDFYKKVKNIESTRNKYNSTSKTKSTTSNYTKCYKCGNKYNKSIYKECPHCKKSKNKSNDFVYCKKCGKKYSKHLNTCPYCKNTKTTNFIKCPKCGKWYIRDKECPYCSKPKSSPDVKKIYNKSYGGRNVDSTLPENKSLNWEFCCVFVFIAFILSAILGII